MTMEAYNELSNNIDEQRKTTLKNLKLMLGTDEYLNRHEKEIIKRKVIIACNEIIDLLNSYKF